LQQLQGMAGDRKRITARLSRPLPASSAAALGDVREHTDAFLVIEVPPGRAGEVVGELERIGVDDVSLGDPPLEDTLRTLYRDGGADDGKADDDDGPR
jgi:hypothetical protein